MNIKRIGIDLAKQVFQLHGVDGQEKAVLRKQLRRIQMLAYFKKLPPCLIGMEACSSAHYWGRELQKLGQYRKTDGSAVCKALCKKQQKRRQRCGSHLRSGCAPQHALCCH